MKKNNLQKSVNNLSIQNDCKKLIALVMMIKNEEKRIEVSFDSVKDYTDTFIILDTGSTDSTIQICKDIVSETTLDFS
jgi:hypothetical protein